MKKEETTMSNYLLQVKKIIDGLIAISSLLDVEAQIKAILDGLTEDYDPFIIVVTSRLDSYSIQEIEALLLAQEERSGKYKRSYLGSLQENLA